MAGAAPALEAADTALLLDVPMESGARSACFGHLNAPEEGPRGVINVLLSHGARTRVRSWAEHVGTFPESFVVVLPQAPASVPAAVEVETVQDPGDLTGIGVAVTDHLSEGPEAGTDAVCLRSLTAMLQFAATEEVVRFLEVLGGHLEQYGAVGHAHVDPSAHDESTIETFAPLVDVVVEATEGTASEQGRSPGPV